MNETGGGMQPVPAAALAEHGKLSPDSSNIIDIWAFFRTQGPTRSGSGRKWEPAFRSAPQQGYS